MSYYSPQLERYTSFVSTSSVVRDILSTEAIVLSLTQERLRGFRRQGLPLFTHKYVRHNSLFDSHFLHYNLCYISCYTKVMRTFYI